MDIRAIAMGVLFSLLWSSAFSSARVIVAHAPPVASLALRFLISGLVGVAIARALGQSWRLTRPQWRGTVIFGLCQNALYLGLFFIAMQWIEASLASIIASTMPLMVGLIGWAVLGDRLNRMTVLGLGLGVAGVILIMGTRLGTGTDPIGVALCLAGTLALSIATLSARGASSGGNVLMVVGLQMLAGSAILFVAALFLDERPLAYAPELLWAFTYTVFVPGLLATWVWFTLVNRIGAVRAATFHFLNPFFGVLVAAIVLGEAVRPLDILGVGVVAAGILAVQLGRARRTG
ncbi:DMT family transporter [Maritimibacter alkaliphilus]|uniref:DMT family transporter n=1 Tax=Maritimibacter alkaliphilus TaxID=404236 RepID=UPI001C93B36C|nr:DMT family transporter [Maritimibacter alkaliphilus]MBY6090382.1 DMT family transporter [Maritimibacter alkaliphilus]